MFPRPLPPVRTLGRLFTWAAILLLTGNRARSHEVEVVELPKLLQNGIPQESLEAERSAVLVFRLVIPEGARNLQVDTAGGQGDCDLFVRFGAHPSDRRYDKASTGTDNAERVQFAAPEPGVWYVKLQAANAFRGLKLSARYERTISGDEVPRLLPGPGTYAGRARVQIKTRLATGIVRYTIDGTDPTADSSAYTSPLKFFTDTELRVQTYAGKTARGPVLSAPYLVDAPDAVTPLVNGIVVQHRAGIIGSEALFKFTVPAGMERLHLLTRSGTGHLTILARHGQPPTTGAFDFKQPGIGTRIDLAVEQPAAGEWFIMLRGRSNYSGVALQASYRGPKPDLIAWPEILNPYETTETFEEADCEVQENMITAGTHRLLRFSTESRNIGGRDLVMGSPEGNPNFEFQECHGHYHFKGFAAYELKDGEGNLVAEGRKVSFCLEDVRRWDETAPARRKYTCDEQGIRVGWSDIYDSGLPGQWIDITGVPAGDYFLEITINPDLLLDEADYSNNTTIIPVSLGG